MLSRSAQEATRTAGGLTGVSLLRCKQKQGIPIKSQSSADVGEKDPVTAQRSRDDSLTHSDVLLAT